ncbi:unnamed protein product, partial [Ectocarpus fasciculatus]
GEIAVASRGGGQEGEPLASGAQPGAGEGCGGASEDHHATGGALQPEAGPARDRPGSKASVPRAQGGSPAASRTPFFLWNHGGVPGG